MFFQGEIWSLPVIFLDSKQQKPTFMNWNETGLNEKGLGSECNAAQSAPATLQLSKALPRPAPAATTFELAAVCQAHCSCALEVTLKNQSPAKSIRCVPVLSARAYKEGISLGKERDSVFC